MFDAALESDRRATTAASGLIADIASAQPANPVELAMYRSTVGDDDVYSAFEAIGDRGSAAALFAPRVSRAPA